MNIFQPMQIAMQERINEWKDLLDASKHEQNCTCDKCRAWWAKMQKDVKGTGPFINFLASK